MDIATLQSRIIEFLKKYKYVALILIIGLVLMSLPGKSDETDSSVESTPVQTDTQPSVSEQLAEILSKIEGAGNVQVLLTIAAGEETVYQTDDNISVTNDSSTTQIDTVTITDASRNQTGLIRQINPPAYQGAIIVCQGADSSAVKLAIVDAVSKITGLGADRICVLKMK